MPFTAARLIAVIEAAGYEPRPHPGRGMFDLPCVAFAAGDDDLSHADVVADIEREAADGAEHAALTRGVRVVGVGRDAVFYWPDMPWPDEGDDAGSDDAPPLPAPLPIVVSPGADKPFCLRCHGHLDDPIGTPGDSLCACRACNGTGHADGADLARAEAEVAAECARARADAWWRR